MRTRVKICGITRKSDAEFATKMGVDALGFVFYPPSPRAISVEAAQDLLQNTSLFVTKVALFVNASAEDVHHCINTLPIDILQFHGDESPQYCEQFSKPYLKAVRMHDSVNLRKIADDYRMAEALLLDSYKAGTPGGTGQTFDWSLIEKINKPVILAGGLNADNVAVAIKKVQPYAVDVSGGVEELKGIKSNIKVSAFMQEVVNG